MRHPICLFAVIALFFSGVSLNFAEIITVPDDYTSIQTAIDNSSEEDTILVSPGIYYEKLSIESHAITLASLDIFNNQNPPVVENTIISGLNLPYDRNSLINIVGEFADTVRIIGLSIVNSANFNAVDHTFGGGLYSENVNIEIEGCHFENNVAYNGAGIFLSECYAKIHENYIFNNIAYHGGGINMFSSEAIIVNNTLVSNSSTGNSGGGGIRSRSTSRGKIQCNIISNCFSGNVGGGIYLGGTWIVENNIFQDNSTFRHGGGLSSMESDSLIIRNNIFLNNEAVDTTENNFDGYGGALSIFLTESFTLVEKNCFYNNTSLLTGGGVVLAGDSLNFRSNTLVGNKSRWSGAIKLMNVNSILTDIFINNNLIKYSRFDENNYWEYRGAIIRGNGAIGYISDNDISGNFRSATGTNTENGELILTDNYWGHESGPYHRDQNPSGQGDTVNISHDIIPFATEPIWNYGLEFETDATDFGYVAPGESETQYMELSNTTDEELMIYKLLWIFNNAFTAPEMDSLVIMPFETITIPVTFTPQDSINYFDILSTVAFDHRASGSTIEFLGTGIYNDVDENNGTIPTQFTVSELHPNPFNSQSNLKVFLPQPASVEIKVYDIQGREVQTIARTYLGRGETLFNVNMSGFSSGIYFVRVQAGHNSFVRKMLLIG